VRPGKYELELTSTSSQGTAVPVTRTLLVVPPAPPPEPQGAPSTGAGGYVAVSPFRIADTRTGDVPAIGPGGRIDLPVLGRGGVPASGVASVVVETVAVCPT